MFIFLEELINYDYITLKIKVFKVLKGDITAQEVEIIQPNVKRAIVVAMIVLGEVFSCCIQNQGLRDKFAS